MTIWFLVVLASISTIVCLSGGLRARHNTPLSASERYKRRMSLIAPRRMSAGRWVVVPESRDDLARASFRKAQRRRRIWLIYLGTAAAISGIVAVVKGGTFVELHLLVDAVVVFYVALLLEAKRRRVERERKVHRLRRAAPARAEPLARVSAGGRRL